jgi:hypothetical protein
MKERPLWYFSEFNHLADTDRCLMAVGHLCKRFTIFDHQLIVCGRPSVRGSHRCFEHINKSEAASK